MDKASGHERFLAGAAGLLEVVETLAEVARTGGGDGESAAELPSIDAAVVLAREIDRIASELGYDNQPEAIADFRSLLTAIDLCLDLCVVGRTGAPVSVGDVATVRAAVRQLIALTHVGLDGRAAPGRRLVAVESA